MPVELFAATPIEVYTITAADYLVAVGMAGLLALLAAGLGALVFSLGGEPADPEPSEVDSPEAADTVELPRRRSGPRTGTIHAPQYHRPSDDATVVIERVETRR